MINFDKIDAMLVTKRENVRYLTGFTGSAGICIMYPHKKYLLTDFRYKEQSGIESPDCEIVIIKDKYKDDIKRIFEDNKTKTVGFEASDITYAQYESYSFSNLIPYDCFTDDLRIVKTPEEIECISHASDIAQEALIQTMPYIKIGVSESEIACELDFRMRKLGASGNSFDTIAVGGRNSSVVHGTPGGYKLQNGDFILIDFGCVYKGYCSDMTRTLAIGDISRKQKDVYNIVLTAQLEALKALKAGVRANYIDKIARDIIEDAGYGDCFGHALGHGVGLEIHEEPRLSKKNDGILTSGMVVTVEPGIYIEGEFGVRIEDLVVITDKNNQNLCQKIKKEVIYI